MSNSDPLATLNPSIVGQAEKAHTAVLKKVLSGTTLDEQQWITIQLAISAGDNVTRSDLVDRVVAAAKYEPHQVQVAIDALAKSSLLQDPPGDSHLLSVTPEGKELVSQLRQKVAAFIGETYGSVPGDDLATAARVLTTITAKLSERLAQS